MCPPARPSCRQRVSVLGLGAWLSSLNVCLFPRTALSPHHGGKAFLLCICRCQTLKLGEHVPGLERPGRRLLPALDFGNESAWLVGLPSSARYRGRANAAASSVPRAGLFPPGVLHAREHKRRWAPGEHGCALCPASLRRQLPSPAWQSSRAAPQLLARW